MIKAQKNTPTQKELIPQGSHIARCYSIVHIGTVQWEYLGEVKHTDKIRLTWELPNETKVFKEENGEQPFVISKEYTLSMHEKSNLRRDVESWIGALTEQQADDFDISDLMGKPCMLNILHREAKNGNTYSNVGTVNQLIKGVECPVQYNQSIEFNYGDSFNLEWLRVQPDFIKEMIGGTPEYKGRIADLEIDHQLNRQLTEGELPQ
jgi:hypothetical protein